MKNPIGTVLRIVAISILFLLATTACVVPIPVDDKVPYTGDYPNPNHELITRDDIVQRFGEPEAVYSHGSIFVYSDFEQTWEIPYFLAAPGAYGADVGVAILGIRHYMILTFDDFGYLADRRIEQGDGRTDCSESGFCYTVIGQIVWLASKEEEARIKDFPISSIGCGIYLYLEGTHFPRQTTLTLDGDSLGHVGSIGAGFFYLEVNQGAHLMVAKQENAEPDTVELPVVCQNNEHIFIRLKIRHNTKSAPILEMVDNSTGRGKIRWRHLVIAQSSR